MKTSKVIPVILSLLAPLLTNHVHATNLMAVYEDSLANDPKFKAAHSQYLANKEALVISRADFFPQLSAAGNIARTRSDTRYTAAGTNYAHYYNNSATYQLTITQPIFNFKTWANVWGTQALVYKAEATYLASQEDLLQRTATAYFDVLTAKDILTFAQAKKSAMLGWLTQTKHKYDVGLVPVADLENARANYDVACSEEIGAKNDLAITLERLSEFTKIKYTTLSPIKSNLPLLVPIPSVIESWVKAAEKQNFSLSAARYDVLAARENIKLQTSGHFPTLNAQASHSYQYNSNNPISSSSGNIPSALHGKTTQGTLELNVPLFQGGKVLASTRQADYQYQEKSQIQEQVHREVVSKTRQAYLSVLSTISKLHSDRQAIKSAQSYLRATQASYKVGAKSTLADVLDAQTKVYAAQKNFAKDQYAYITNFLALKTLTGTLSVDDLKQINEWLGHKTANIKSKKTMPQTQPITATTNKLVVLSTEQVKPVINNNAI